MNYLAHIYLSGNQPDLQVGGFLGDFVKGVLDRKTHTPFYEGLLLHRRIDAYTDGLPEMKALRDTFPPPLRRYSGIILDILFDHFLARNWSGKHPLSLEQFCSTFYEHLQQHFDALPERARDFSLRAPQIGWLQSYSEFENLHPILERVSRNLSRPVELQAAISDIETAYSDYQEQFLRIFPLVEAFAHQQLADILGTHAACAGR